VGRIAPALVLTRSAGSSTRHSTSPRRSRPRCRPARIIHSKRLALSPGIRIGVYEVTAQIGEGGMGQVYRATDATLGRQVAIKILPEAFASDPDRLARFEREATSL
jgi:serine/threonine protein kinase